MRKVYTPRNNLVLIEQEARGKVRGLHMPDRSEEGKRLIIRAVGPEVKGLEVGDEVLAVGTPNQDLVRIPGESNLYLTREANVLCVIAVKEEA